MAEPLSWADGAGSLPISSITHLKHPRNFSGLRSSSTNPFSSLRQRHRQPRKFHSFINSFPRSCCHHTYQKPYFHSSPSRTSYHPSQPHIPIPLNWDLFSSSQATCQPPWPLSGLHSLRYKWTTNKGGLVYATRSDGPHHQVIVTRVSTISRAGVVDLPRKTFSSHECVHMCKPQLFISTRLGVTLLLILQATTKSYQYTNFIHHHAWRTCISACTNCTCLAFKGNIKYNCERPKCCHPYSHRKIYSFNYYTSKANRKICIDASC